MQFPGARPTGRVQPDVRDLRGGALGQPAAVQEDQAHSHQGDGYQGGLGSRRARLGCQGLAGGVGEAAYAPRGLSDLPGKIGVSDFMGLLGTTRRS